MENRIMFECTLTEQEGDKYVLYRMGEKSLVHTPTLRFISYSLEQAQGELLGTKYTDLKEVDSYNNMVDITLYVKEGANTISDLHRQATFTEKGRIRKTPKECLITILKVWLQELEQDSDTYQTGPDEYQATGSHS